LHGGADGDPDGVGLASLWVAEDAGQLCWSIRTAGIDPPTAVHLHAGPTGEPAPVVLPLLSPMALEFVDCGAPPPGVDLAAVVARPHEHSVDVHTAAFPDGA